MYVPAGRRTSSLISSLSFLTVKNGPLVQLPLSLLQLPLQRGKPWSLRQHLSYVSASAEAIEAENPMGQSRPRADEPAESEAYAVHLVVATKIAWGVSVATGVHPQWLAQIDLIEEGK